MPSPPRARLGVSLLAVACNAPISNAFLAEDLAYLAALPSEDQQSISVDPAASPQEISDLLLSAAEVNASVQEMLRWVEAISVLPPTTRAHDRRSWGPYPAEDLDLDWRAEIVRVDQGRFAWAFSLRQGGQGEEWGDFFLGESVAGFDPRQSAGWLRFDADLMAEHGGDAGWTGALEVSFDYINEYSLEGRLDVDGNSATYAYEADAEAGEAWFWYSAPLNLDDTTPALETYTVGGRWRLSGGGRGDTVAAGGDLGSAAAYRTLCWDSTGALTYDRQAIDGYGFYEEGTVESCLYDEPIDTP